MSLPNVSMLDMIKKQYMYKCKSYIQVLTSLIFIQVLAILFSLGGSSMMGSTSSSYDVNVYYYSADIVIVFTMLWGFITSILITTKAYRSDDFTFVTNRLTSGISNILFLLTASLLGGLTAMLSTFVIKDIRYLIGGTSFTSTEHAASISVELLLGLFAAVLYIILFSALGYLAGTLVQFYRGFIVLLPALFIGLFFISGSQGANSFLTFVYHFLFTESSFILFVGKIVVLAILFFGSALALSNRMEVNS